MFRRAGAIALTLCCVSPTLSRAQTTPESAAALQQQIQDWVATTLGPNVKVNKELVRLTPEGDHYGVVVPFGNAPDALAITASARETVGGPWVITDIRVPSPATFTMNAPAGLVQGMPAGKLTSDVTIGQQAGQILFDPSFATASTANSMVQDVDTKTTGSGIEQQTHMDHGVSSMIMQPAADGRVNLVFDTTVENYRIHSKVPNAPAPIDLAMVKAHLSGSADGLSRDRVIQIVHMAATAGGAGAAEAERAAGAALLESLADLAQGGMFVETIDKLAVSFQGMDGALSAVRIGLAGKSDGGLLQANLDLGAEGLTLPDLGLGTMADLIPTKVSLHPTVSGVPTDALMTLARKSGGHEGPTQDDIEALFSRGGITAGLDSIAVDVAGASFTGMGKMVFTSPEAFTGSGQVTATNFELLQQRIAAEPSLAQANPLLIFMKGIARNSGDRLVWDISYRDGHAIVNNQDLTALAAAGRGGDSQPAEPRPAPVRPQAHTPTGPNATPLIRPARPRQQ